MKAINAPAGFPILWGQNAGGSFIRSIPQTTATPGAASLDQGFPPVTFDQVGAGGIPPDGKDFNGILQQLSAWSQWVQVGGPNAWNSAQSTAIGGYPNGALVQSATTPGKFWVSTADDNASNPDSGGANWTQANLANLYAADTSGAANTITLTYSPAPASLASLVGVPLLAKIANANTSQTVNVVVNGFASTGLVLTDGSLPKIGQIATSALALIVFDGAHFQWLSTGAPPKNQTRTILSSGANNYSPPTGCTRLHVRMVGAGAGAGGVASGATGPTGGAGGNTVFGAVTANGGAGGVGNNSSAFPGTGGAGGTSGAGSATNLLRIAGQKGGDGSFVPQNNTTGWGGCGGNSPFFGGGAPGAQATSGTTSNGYNATAPGGGGSAGGRFNLTLPGGGGGGEYAEFDVFAPGTSPIAYSVGAAGVGATPVGQPTSGNGFAGQIIIDEFYS